MKFTFSRVTHIYVERMGIHSPFGSEHLCWQVPNSLPKSCSFTLLSIHDHAYHFHKSCNIYSITINQMIHSNYNHPLVPFITTQSVIQKLQKGVKA
uniref:Uncharacterized protein n=1 Tax=Picea glauca TaxID=3330 RepID=A0A101M014_PICGL|nr:hypothetical protein ABT39_MTgene4556 [Picea glauca]QHR87123.1 hypothetical protein Q903MT_gene1132 [Picea sitchensis]